MTEEHVTKAILKWLLANEWEIICFDFPQSGTGKFIHKDDDFEQKNKDTINPDIICVKGKIALYFENKDHYYFPDYEKVYELINNNLYLKGIFSILNKREITNIYYGIGIPLEKYKGKAKENETMTDFIVTVDNERKCSFAYNKLSIEI